MHFDGTLCENRFPQIGEPKHNVINRLKQEKLNGAKIILWTCRDGEMLTQAIKWCEAQGIVFDAVNENLNEVKEWMNSNSRKVYATEYWDDRAVSIADF